uniref:Protein kinase domain-containing protein n=1 Tax=Setaria italica TaxID=4555 RepID=K3YE94_SETIT
MEAWRPPWLALSSVLLLSPAASQQPPGCRHQCGNITVPNPFGIGAGCHRAAAAGSGGRGFELDVAGYGHEVSAISMPSAEATVLLNASRACYDRPGDADGRAAASVLEHPMALNGSAFLFSSMKRKFVSIGCPELTYFVDGGGDYVAGCMSVCRPSGSTPLPGSCRGHDGCCQNNIPFRPRHLPPLPRQLHPPRRPAGQVVNLGMTTTLLANSTGCSYAFMVDAMWFWFWLAGTNFNRTGDFAVPVVLDWAISDAPSCAAARRDPTAYACRSAQSVCLESSNGPGYTCNCTGGYEGNPYVTNGCTASPARPKGSSGNATIPDGCRPDDKFTLALKAVTGVSIGVFLPLVSCFSAHLWLQKKRLLRAKRRFFEQHGGLLLQQQLGSLASSGVTFKIFSEEEVRKATDGFAEARVLGRGGQGVVYKGVLADGSAVAVKRSRVMEEKQVSGFAREMLILSQINHRNVVKLLGCCLEVEAPILVYEYVPNGSLHGHIHTGDGGKKLVLPADARLRIAAEAADAVAYIQSSASPPILHRDVKTANILLDGEVNAKVSDFGASRVAPADGAAVAALVQGTLGYLLTCQLTGKSDVYSFAVVVLELLTGRKAFCAEDDREDGCLAFSFLAAAQAGQHREVMDGRVMAVVGLEVVDEAAELVAQCLSLSSEERPTMKEVANKLQTLTTRACSGGKNAGTKTNGVAHY